MDNARTAIVMASGGARAAYQIGVLRRIAHMRPGRYDVCPFGILEGVSAGAINAAALAAGASEFHECTARLVEMWSGLRPSDIFRTDVPALSINALRWIKDLTFGGAFGFHSVRSLLDARPLRGLLSSHLNLQAVTRNIRDGVVRKLAVVATDYASSRTCVFVDGARPEECWTRRRNVAIPTRIGVDHLCASTAIPVLFQPVSLHTMSGTSWFGDGCMRLPAPLGPAIRLGADRILAIGLRHRTRDNEPLSEACEIPQHGPTLAQVVGTSLSALFVDQLDSDCDHLERLNSVHSSDGTLRPVHALYVTPSVDLGALAVSYFHEMPAMLRFLLAGLGARETGAAELMSYILFVSDYIKALIDIGYHDAALQADAIESLLHEPCMV